MASQIHWGPPGSYKTSSAVWFYLLPALRAGRVVVTNVEGMYPLKTIEKMLGETFPSSARMFRIGSLKERYRDLWRRWWHWMPIGAFILMDEAQDIYPAKGWREEDLNLKPVDFYSEVLPPELFKLFKSTREDFAPELDESSTDDTGDLQFDSDGLIIYPQTLNECYKRHRKYNWDIHLCTPDISQIHKIIRGASELAVAYKNKDTFLSKRRPRLVEHDPSKRVITPTKLDVVYQRKVPVDVHLLYKSTQTGQITKSGAASTPLAGFKAKVVLFVILPAALIWGSVKLHAVLTRHETPVAPVTSSAQVAVPATAPQSPGAVPAANGNSLSAPGLAQPGFLMPFEATKIYLVGRSCRGRAAVRDCASVYEFRIGNKALQADDVTLADAGYSVLALSSCRAEIRDPDGHKLTVFCRPSDYPDVAPAGPVAQIQPALLVSTDGASKNQPGS